MNKAALLIGVSEYNSKSGLKPLPSAAEDVQAMQRILLHSSEFTAENITVLTNPQKHDVEEAIYQLFTDRQKEDLLLFYFSGHGIKDETGKLYFSLPTTRKNQNGSLIKYTALPATVLHESMNDSRSTCQVLVLDCCFSGAFAKGLTVKDDGSVDVRAQLGGKGRAIFTSSNSVEYSFHQDSLKLSIYTHFFVEGLETGVADLDSDGLISADEMHIYVSEKVKQAAPKMTPQFFPAEQGHRIYLARSSKDDPQLKYRKAFEQKVNQGSFQISQKRFSIPARKALDLLRLQLGISIDVVEMIEAEVTEPLRGYQRKLQEYEKTLWETLEDEGYPLKEATRMDLNDYQLLLGLRDEDTQEIEIKTLPELANVPLDPLKQTVSLKQNIERELKLPFFDRLIELVRQRIESLPDKQIAYYTGVIITGVEERFSLRDKENFSDGASFTFWFLSKGLAQLDLSCQQKIIKHLRREEFEPGDGTMLAIHDLITAAGGVKGDHYYQEDDTIAPSNEGWELLDQVFRSEQLNALRSSLSDDEEMSSFKIPLADNEDDLSSERFGATYYTNLRDLLKAGKWKEANRETFEQMLEITNKQFLDESDINKFPYQDLQNIDRLWTKHSNNQFGFSVQQRVYSECGAKATKHYIQYPGDTIWGKFLNCIGWKGQNTWVKSKNSIIFDTTAPIGHLPYGEFLMGDGVGGWGVRAALMKRFIDC